MKRLRRKLPFSHLSLKEKFERLFQRGFTRERAEIKLQYPYRALLLPDKILKYWHYACQNQIQLREIYERLGGFDLIRSQVIGEDKFYSSYERDLLYAIANRICGADFDYKIINQISSGEPYFIYITEFYGVL